MGKKTDMKITSELKNIKAVSAEITSRIEKTKEGISRDTLFDIKLCVEEAVRNAMIHGNRSDKKQHVLVSYEIEADKVRITIEDNGNGFKVRDLPDPTHSDNLYAEGGRGVYIMHRLMDKVQYNQKGNRVTMEKRFILKGA